MPPRTTASTDWKSAKATTAAVDRFKADFERSMGGDLVIGRKAEPYKVIPTGSLVLDAKLGVGGWPVGRIHQLWGPDGAGKTTLAILAAIEAQRTQPDKLVGWNDMEQNFDVKWAQDHGLDMDRVAFYTPRNAEDTADSVTKMVRSGLFSYVTLDSVGGMISRIEQEKNADEATVGLVAKIVTRAVKNAAPMANATGTTLMILNQVRAKIGGYGPDESEGGGWALKHVTTTKCYVRRGGGEPIKARFYGQDVPVGYTMAVRVQRNKVYPAGEVAEIVFRTRESDKHGPIGVDVPAEAFEVGTRFGAIEQQPGGWYVTPDGERLRGQEKVLDHLRSHPQALDLVRGRALEALSGKVVDHPAAEEESPDEDDPMGVGDML